MMISRLILDNENEVKLLCEDGTIFKCSDSILYSILMDFDKNNNLVNGKDGRWDQIYPDMSMYPGDTIAFVLKQRQLVINDISYFKKFIVNDTPLRKYIATAEYAEMHSVTPEIVKVHCRNGRIERAKKVGRAWTIPENAEYPVDCRKSKNKMCK